jgi:hypothetical protein
MRLAPIATLACVALLALAGPAAANTFSVTTTADDVGSCDPGDCSVREALAAADANPGADTVNIPAGHYVLTNGELFTDVANDALNIVGHSARDTTLDAAGNSRVLDALDGNVNVSHLTISGGVAPSSGGFDPGQGGGIFFDGQQMVLDHVAVVGNKALAASFGGQGGGVFGGGPVTVTNSLISGNTADGTGNNFSGGQGGGIFGNEVLVLTNVTVANNVATPADSGASFPHSQGGGIFVNQQGTTFTHVTIAGNQVTDTDSSGGVFLDDNATFVNSIVAGNTASGGPGDCDANGNTISEQGHNLMGTPVDCHFNAPGDITADPLLGALANNGGETDTEALPAGSPAIDKADGAFCPSTDQRDVTRPQLGGCDLGAFEFVPPPLAPPAAPADTTKPTIHVKGIRRACLKKRVVVRVQISDASGIRSVVVKLDGKRIRRGVKKSGFKLVLDPRKLKAGKHLLQIVAVDNAGNRRIVKKRFTRCGRKH